ncbi:hypothetical protein AB1K70_00740 [Bremerella sp. JC770]|uniref:hypothetical protein n=1 Tax=Bremerella sp. JC770 TaxID=3232137 RepID=UPI00345A671A
MAKKATNKPSKADAIRNFQKDNPDASPTVVADALKKSGYKDVTPQYVSTIKSMDKRKANGPTKSGKITAEDLMTAKEFVDTIGGVGRAKQAMDMLSKLTH